MKKVVVCNSLEKTELLGKIISQFLFPGAVISLDGNLGAGKTTFTKAIALGLGIVEHVSSPTFNILKCYFGGRLPFYHIDAYRLEDSPNRNIGLEEVIEGDGVCIIEWGVFIKEMIYEPLIVKINILDENTREFVFESDYPKYGEIFTAIGGIIDDKSFFR